MASNGELEDNEVGEGSSEVEDVGLEEVGEIQKEPHCLTMMRDGFEYQELEVDEESDLMIEETKMALEPGARPCKCWSQLVEEEGAEAAWSYLGAVEDANPTFSSSLSPSLFKFDSIFNTRSFQCVL